MLEELPAHRIGERVSSFNLKIRQLSAETSHDFIEWCGLVDDQERNNSLVTDTRLYKNELYLDFINEYPDYGPRPR